MNIENFCDFIKKIHQDPLAQITDLTIGDVIGLQVHFTECKECDTLAQDVLDRFQNVPPKQNTNDGRYN